MIRDAEDNPSNDIYSIRGIRRVLEMIGVRPTKSRGQNFLIDKRGHEAIARFAAIEKGDPVLEIGPGLGGLTRVLLDSGVQLTVVDVEEQFIQILDRLAAAPKTICSDVRQIMLADIAPPDERLIVVGNLPYSLSSEIMLWVFDQSKFINRAVFLLQREVAERIAAEPGNRECGILSVYRALLANAKLGSCFNGEQFFPRAGVESQLLRLDFYAEPKFPLDAKQFRGIVRAGFSKRRKTLLNSFADALTRDNFLSKESDRENISRDSISSWLSCAQIDAGRRAESLSLSEWARLAQSFPFSLNP